MSLHTLFDLQNDPDLRRVPEQLLSLPAFRNCVTLFSGREKVGKTTKLSQEIAEASHRMGVLWLAIDEWRGFVVQRLTLAGADARLLIEDERIEVVDLEAVIREHQIDVCVVDTLREFASGMVLDSADDMQWTPLMRAIREIAQSTGSAIALVHHNAKGSNDYSGSTAIAAGADVLVNMTVDGDAKSIRRMFTVKARLPVVSYVEDWIEGKYLRVHWDPSATTTATVEEKVVMYVTQHPGCTLNTLKTGVTGCRTQAVGEAVKELLASGHLVNRGNGRGKQLHIGVPFDRSPDRSPTPLGDRLGIAAGTWTGIAGITVGLRPGSVGNYSGIASDSAPRRDDRGSSLSPSGRDHHLEHTDTLVSEDEIERLAIQAESTLVEAV